MNRYHIENKILYLDDDLVAVHKPSGLMVDKSRITDDKTFLLQQLRDQIKRIVNAPIDDELDNLFIKLFNSYIVNS